MAKPIFADYIGKYQIKDIDFENLSLGTLPPIFYGEYGNWYIYSLYILLGQKNIYMNYML